MELEWGGTGSDWRGNRVGLEEEQGRTKGDEVGLGRTRSD